MTFTACASAADIAEGSLTPIEAAGKKLMLAKAEGAFYAMQRKCPHMGFDLCKGHVEGRAVRCRMHGALFDLSTGEPLEKAKLLFIKMQPKPATTYQVKVDGGQVMVDA